jgi:hypothetical protein
MLVSSGQFLYSALLRPTKPGRIKADELTERSRPKLKCSFSMDDPDCALRGAKITMSAEPLVTGWGLNTGVSIVRSPALSRTSIATPTAYSTARVPGDLAREVDYFRLKVETAGAAAVSSCRGRLLWVKRGEHQVVGSMDLPFAPSEDADTQIKKIHAGVPAYLDVLTISKENKVEIASPGHRSPSHVRFDVAFAERAEYRLRVVVTSDAPATHCELLFRWTGDRNTAELSCKMLDA